MVSSGSICLSFRFFVLGLGQDRRGSLRGDDESFPENHEGRLRPELGGLIDVRESEEVSTVFQECDSGSNIRHWNRPLAVGTPTPPRPCSCTPQLPPEPQRER